MSSLALLLPLLFAVLSGVLYARARRHLTPLGRERWRDHSRRLGAYLGVREDFTDRGWQLRNYGLAVLTLGMLSIVVVWWTTDL